MFFIINKYFQFVISTIITKTINKEFSNNRKTNFCAKFQSYDKCLHYESYDDINRLRIEF